MKKRIEVKLLDGTVENVAQDWDSLSEAEYLSVVSVLFQFMLYSIDPSIAKITLTEVLLHQEIGYFDTINQNIIQPAIEEDAECRTYYDTALFEIFQLSDFILNPTNEEHTAFEVKYHRTRLWENVRVLHFSETEKWIAPSDGLSNITFEEWILLSSFYEAYIQEYNQQNLAEAEKSLDKILATMWREPNPLYQIQLNSVEKKMLIVDKNKKDVRDTRLPLIDRELQISERAKRWEKIRNSPSIAAEMYSVRRGLLFWFQSCRNQITTKYPDAFSQGNGTKQSVDYHAMVISIAGDITKIDFYLKSNVHDVLAELNLKAQAAKQHK